MVYHCYFVCGIINFFSLVKIHKSSIINAQRQKYPRIMGRNKRKRDNSLELTKKIKKLIKSRSSSTSPSISSESSYYREPQSVGDCSGEASEVEFLDESLLELDEELPNINQHETPKIENSGETEKEKCLPMEILSILGEGKKPTETLGKKVPKEISERWGKIIQDGLAKEIKEGLINKTLIPENFQLAKAPKLNAEVSAILSDSTRNRDKRLEKSQNQLALLLQGW
ncbi:hypothetical protein MSG28_001219 [Choristoneura fumiferana]|uniref:Uncharacterized protein n=1 Tax=Choristoneura fumiferana TaxID=7141 RepID=A0ACC0K470_CHOFU|nr:hypothetical protein MSG28_001219 [Choristoneura fumiferana]